MTAPAYPIFTFNNEFFQLSLHPQVSALSNSVTNGLKFTPHLAKSGQIIIILEVPLFTTRLSYILSGCLIFRKENNGKIMLNLPDIELTSLDMTDTNTVADLDRIKEGNYKDLAAVALSGERHEFVLVLPDGTHIETITGFTKVGDKFFLGPKTLECPLFEIIGDQLITYCKDLQMTAALLHHLHLSMVGVCIIPKTLYQPDLSPNEISELVKNSLFRELEELEGGSKGDFKDLRSKMVSLEHQTDILVSRLNEKTHI